MVGAERDGLYVVSGDGVLFFFDRGGNERWRTGAGGPVSGATLGRDRLYVGVAGGRLVGFDRWDGFPSLGFVSAIRSWDSRWVAGRTNFPSAITVQTTR